MLNHTLAHKKQNNKTAQAGILTRMNMSRSKMHTTLHIYTYIHTQQFSQE
jgi:hypothetical protein